MKKAFVFALVFVSVSVQNALCYEETVVKDAVTLEEDTILLAESALTRGTVLRFGQIVPHDAHLALPHTLTQDVKLVVDVKLPKGMILKKGTKIASGSILTSSPPIGVPEGKIIDTLKKTEEENRKLASELAALKLCEADLRAKLALRLLESCDLLRQNKKLQREVADGKKRKKRMDTLEDEIDRLHQALKGAKDRIGELESRPYVVHHVTIVQPEPIYVYPLYPPPVRYYYR